MYNVIVFGSLAKKILFKSILLPLLHLLKCYQGSCCNTEGHLIFLKSISIEKLYQKFWIFWKNLWMENPSQHNNHRKKKAEKKRQKKKPKKKKHKQNTKTKDRTRKTTWKATWIIWRRPLSHDEQFVLKASVSHCSTVIPSRQTPNQL